MSLTIDINKEFKEGLHLMNNTEENVFITGRAGTGKSTLLSYFRDHTKKDIAVMAPTGVAAVNVKGVTIHSFFGFKPNITLSKVKKIRDGEKHEVISKINTIVIDEISMVRADLLDCVDKSLRIHRQERNKPFGGIQMIFFGDLYQLPPVVQKEEKELFINHYKSPYFFEAFCFEGFKMEYVELKKIYRQESNQFISILNAIRNKTISKDQLDTLNHRVNKNIDINKLENAIVLTTINRKANEINQQRLHNLKNREHSYRAKVTGDMDPKYYPTDDTLHLKEGAQIMMLNNDTGGRWVNGTLAKIVKCSDKNKKLQVKLTNGSIEDVKPFSWDVFHFTWNDKISKIETTVQGSFKQLPVKLAWAITIHKSQGKTYDNVVIDLSRGAFAYGQVYVALSRCRTLEGIILKQPIKESHILVDWRVMDFITTYQYQISEKTLPLEHKIELIEKAMTKKKRIKITYLKSDDTKSQRTIEPLEVGEMYYMDKQFIGIRGFCNKRKENRIFRVDRILEMKITNSTIKT